MKKFALLFALVALTTAAFAASAKSYQVTGPVVSVGDGMIVVQKADEAWEVACDNTLSTQLHVGDKVTVYYQVVAKKIELKAATTTVKPVPGAKLLTPASTAPAPVAKPAAVKAAK